MLSSTASLRRELTRVFPDRPFTVSFWDGTEVPATAPEPVTFTFHSPKAMAHLLRSPGELGLGRAYVAGMVDVDDFDKAIKVITDWQPPEIGTADQVRLGLAVVRAAGITRPPRTPSIELRQQGVLHSLSRDRSAIDYHYNAGNDFFALFLDPTMTYSCAIFSRGATTLEEAQFTKLDLVCRKLDLQPGQRLLDVGCGWGALAIHAARHFGVQVLGITLAEEQADLARERVGEAGLSDLVEIRLADYRELHEAPFDAISSIGMVEHVGAAQIDVYAEQLFRQLKPGGLLLNHGIAQLHHGDDNEAGPFSERYVFPDGDPLPLSRILLSLERAGFTAEHIEGFASDYAETLRHWTRRFDERFEDAVRIAGRQRARVWQVYLRAARQGFETGFESIYQVRARKPDGAEPPPVPASYVG